MAWEEDSRICLHMQLIAILSRIGVNVSSVTDKKPTGDLLMDFSSTLREGWRGAEQIEYDRIRQDWLEHMGYKVLRFTNEEVLFDIERVIDIIKNNF